MDLCFIPEFFYFFSSDKKVMFTISSIQFDNL